jgi:hypothetical protein
MKHPTSFLGKPSCIVAKFERRFIFDHWQARAFFELFNRLGIISHTVEVVSKKANVLFASHSSPPVRGLALVTEGESVRIPSISLLKTPRPYA